MAERVLLITKRTDIDDTEHVTDVSGRNFSIGDAGNFKDVLVIGENEKGEVSVIEYPVRGEAIVHTVKKGNPEVFRYLTGGQFTPKMTTVAVNTDADKI